MVPRFCPLLACVIASGVLAVGCGGLRPRDGGAARESAGSNGSPRRSEREEENALAKRAAAHAHYAAGVIHDMNEEPEEALQEFYQAALGDPGDESLVLEISHRLLQKKQPDKALELLLPAAARRDASGAIFARLGFVYSQMGKNELAVEANRAAIKKLPSSLASYQSLFLAYLQNKQSAEALKVLDEAAKLEDANAEFLIGVAELYAHFVLQFPSQRQSVQTRARAVLSRAQQLKPANPQLHLRLADSFYLLGDNDRAAQLYLESLPQLGDLPQVREVVRAKLADIYLRAQDRKRAVEQLDAILRDDPSNAQAYYYLGSIAYDDKRWAEAVEDFKKTLLFSPNFEQAYYDLASVQIAADQPAEALATLEEAQRKFVQNFAAEYLRALAFSGQKAYAEAIKHFTAAEIIAQATDPKRLTPQFYFHLGSAFERNGDCAQAEKQFEKCLQLSPEFTDALNYLGYMWAEHGVNLEKARGLIEKALKLEPENAAFLDSMGWVLFKLHQPKAAIEYILKAVKLNDGPDAILYDHLGDVYAALNETDNAREAWRKSLSIEPDEQVQKKLGSTKSE